VTSLQAPLMLESDNQQNPHLKQIQTYIDRLPSLSTTAAKVLETCNNPGASPNELNRVISLDLVLTGQVLKLINSAYYSIPHPISSLTRAIIMLGINTVKNLVLSFAILQHMRNKRTFAALCIEDFWAHSLCVGVTAKCLAVAKGVSLTDQEEFFVGGLLHDLGKIPLNYLFPEKCSQALDKAKRSQRALFHAEGVVFGIDHAAVGGMIAEKWQLSPALIQTLSFHHRPEEAHASNHQLVFMVALADIFAQLLQMGSCNEILAPDALCRFLLERIEVDWSFLYNLRDTVLDEIARAKIFLEIT
jgi:putative nucleotidyltransferase with HDIG domain